MEPDKTPKKYKRGGLALVRELDQSLPPSAKKQRIEPRRVRRKKQRDQLKARKGA